MQWLNCNVVMVRTELAQGQTVENVKGLEEINKTVGGTELTIGFVDITFLPTRL